jgi:hypothetical protein
MKRTASPWLVSVIAWSAFGASVAAHAAGADKSKSVLSDVHAKVAVVRNEVELIRFVMGRPKNEQDEIQVMGASPRDVYFQALTLFRKADQLCFDHERERAAEPRPPAGPPTMEDVVDVLELAIGRLRKVKVALEIDKKLDLPARGSSETATDAFRAIVQANRQLNLLLDKRFTPSDVFQQVTTGVAYASRLLEDFPEATTLPEPPAYEVGSRPQDCYRRLVDCYKIIRAVAQRSGAQCLEFNPTDAQIRVAEPSDVYDVATLLVAELAHLATLAQTKSPRPVYYAERKLPAHVYQRTGMLERQLTQLRSFVDKSPDWLKQRGSRQ